MISGITAKSVHYGSDLVELSANIDWDCALVCTMEEPWEIVQPQLSGLPAHLHCIENTGIDYLRKLAVPEGITRIVGVGGGSPIDTAKYLGWAYDLPVSVIPTIASVDAMVTPAIAVRTRSIVKYVGNCAPEEVIVSYPVIQAAPERLNRAGLCDILSCHTAQFDWQLAEDREWDVRDESVAKLARDVMDSCIAKLGEIREVTPEGIRTLINGFCTINDLTVGWGSARMEEGSEHFFAYTMEHLTRRHFIHGELVALGILLMSLHQRNDPEHIRDVLDKAGVNYRPDTIGASDDEVRIALDQLSTFVRDNRLWYSAIDDREINPEQLVSELYELIGQGEQTN